MTTQNTMTMPPAKPSARAASANLPYGPFALITGASEGIGAAFARELARQGQDLVLVARRRERLDALASELRAAHGITALVLPADLGKPEEVEQVLKETESIDLGLFVASAGFGSAGDFVDLPRASELDMVDVNCRAVVAMTHPIARRMIARKRGGIVLFSSIVAFQGVVKSATYSGTKAFIQNFAEGLRGELKSHGVDVIAVAPGPVGTGFAARSRMRMTQTEKPEVVARETLAKLGRKGTVRPGMLAKGMEFALATLPRWGRVKVMAQVMAGMAPKGRNEG